MNGGLSNILDKCVLFFRMYEYLLKFSLKCGRLG